MHTKRSFRLLIRHIFKFALFSGIALLLIWFLGGKVQFVEEFNWLIATVLAVISGLILMFAWQFFHGTPIKMLKLSIKENEKLKKDKKVLYGMLVKIQGSGVVLVWDGKYPSCRVSVTGENGQMEYLCSIGLMNYGEKTIEGVEIVFAGLVDTFEGANIGAMPTTKLTTEGITLKQNTTIPIEFVEFIRYKPSTNELLIVGHSIAVDENDGYCFALLVLGKDINDTKWTATVSFNDKVPEIAITIVEKIVL